jgi:glyoxylase-like metal-dependent hydrolase (beta-lactamase superfamily II)
MTWLLRGAVPTLIDAGVGEPEHLQALDEALAGERLEQVLVTHSHIDHASGAAVIAERMPHVRFLKMPWPEHDASWHVRWEPIRDGESIRAGDTSLIAVHTPGHAPDHLCFWEPDSRVMFCGDLAWQGSTVVIPHNHGGDISAYLASLERVIALNPATLLPAHGAVIEHPIELLREYIQHRALREQQVIAALRVGIGNPTEMVARIYPTLAKPLVPVAAESVLAHLIKLEREGKVRRQGEHWSLVTA